LDEIKTLRHEKDCYSTYRKFSVFCIENLKVKVQELQQQVAIAVDYAHELLQNNALLIEDLDAKDVQIFNFKRFLDRLLDPMLYPKSGTPNGGYKF
jgi:hypothetical protein